MFSGWLPKMKQVWGSQVRVFLLRRQRKRFLILRTTNFVKDKQTSFVDGIGSYGTIMSLLAAHILFFLFGKVF